MDTVIKEHLDELEQTILAQDAIILRQEAEISDLRNDLLLLKSQVILMNADREYVDLTQ